MYAKVFKSLFDGSMRGKSDLIIVFINMLCSCNGRGVDDRHPKAIAQETGLSLDRVRQALASLEQVDRESRTPDEDGRRILKLDLHRDWGWRIVNHAKYRDLCRVTERQTYQKEMMRQRRKNANVNTCEHALAPVSTCEHALGVLASSEAEAEAEALPLPPEVAKESGRGFKHSLDPVLSGLRETGKFPNLEVEHLAMIQQSFPMAPLLDHWKAIAEEARALPSNVVGNPFAWLRKRLEEIERKLVAGEAARPKEASRPVFEGV